MIDIKLIIIFNNVFFIEHYINCDILNNIYLVTF